MSLLATSYRYEIDSCNRKALQKALGREESRIKVCKAFYLDILLYCMKVLRSF